MEVHTETPTEVPSRDLSCRTDFTHVPHSWSDHPLAAVIEEL